MKLFFKLFILIVIFSTYSTAEILWADKVLQFSSQAGDKQFSAHQILGKPSVLSGYGGTPCAWMPLSKTQDQFDSITVSFIKSIQVNQICIVENLNPGAVKKIILIDESGIEHIVMDNPSRSNNCESGTFNMSFTKNEYKVNSVKLILYFDQSKVPQLDAVAISDKNDIISWDVDIVNDYKKYETPINLGANINSEFSEVSPVFTEDMKQLYFTRGNFPENIGLIRKQDIWFSKKDKKGNFLASENVGNPVNNEYNNSAFSISPDSKKLYLMNVYNKDGSVTKGISYSILTQDKWSYPKEMKIKDFRNDSENADYFISKDGHYLLLSINNQYSSGGHDIYVSERLDDSLWSSPVNLGTMINTADDEITPYLDNDNKTLYFSSKGHCGYGSQDVFVSIRLDETWVKWSPPKNLGPVINSKLWDAYFKTSPADKSVYFCSYNNSLGQSDIFQSNLNKDKRINQFIKISGNVTDASSGKPIEAQIIIKSIDGKNIFRRVGSDSKVGNYSFNFEFNDKFQLEVYNPYFLSIFEIFDLSENDSLNFIRNFKLTQLKLDSVMKLDNVLFESAHFDLSDQAKVALLPIIETLTNDQSLNIKITGHTDDIGSDDANLVLSINRARTVAEYLETKGISEKRIKFEGLGKSLPIVKSMDESGRKLSRRVEFVISKSK